MDNKEALTRYKAGLVRKVAAAFPFSAERQTGLVNLNTDLLSLLARCPTNPKVREILEELSRLDPAAYPKFHVVIRDLNERRHEAIMRIVDLEGGAQDRIMQLCALTHPTEIDLRVRILRAAGSSRLTAEQAVHIYGTIEEIAIEDFDWDNLVALVANPPSVMPPARPSRRRGYAKQSAGNQRGPKNGNGSAAGRTDMVNLSWQELVEGGADWAENVGAAKVSRSGRPPRAQAGKGGLRPTTRSRASFAPQIPSATSAGTTKLPTISELRRFDSDWPEYQEAIRQELLDRGHDKYVFRGSGRRSSSVIREIFVPVDFTFDFVVGFLAERKLQEGERAVKISQEEIASACRLSGRDSYERRLGGVVTIRDAVADVLRASGVRVISSRGVRSSANGHGISR